MNKEYAGRKSAAEERTGRRKVTPARGTTQDAESFYKARGYLKFFYRDNCKRSTLNFDSKQGPTSVPPVAG
jgi:hypothetical protein